MNIIPNSDNMSQLVIITNESSWGSLLQNSGLSIPRTNERIGFGEVFSFRKPTIGGNIYQTIYWDEPLYYNCPK